MPATVTVVIGCTGVWIASIATGGSVWNGSVHGSDPPNSTPTALGIPSKSGQETSECATTSMPPRLYL